MHLSMVTVQRTPSHPVSKNHSATPMIDTPFDPVRRIAGSTCFSPPMGESPFESGARYLPLIEELP